MVQASLFDVMPGKLQGQEQVHSRESDSCKPLLSLDSRKLAYCMTSTWLDLSHCHAWQWLKVIHDNIVHANSPLWCLSIDYTWELRSTVGFKGFSNLFRGSTAKNVKTLRWKTCVNSSWQQSWTSIFIWRLFTTIEVLMLEKIHHLGWIFVWTQRCIKS